MPNKMTILIIEDDVNDCKNFVKAVEKRNDIEIVGITDSDIEGYDIYESMHPDGIILDLELNNSKNGNADSLEFLTKLKKLCSREQPIIIVTTHINSKRTYELLHKNGVDMILYKEQQNYSSEYVLNRMITLRGSSNKSEEKIIEAVEREKEENKTTISNYIYHELDQIGVTSKLKGREYIHDAILYLIENENSNLSVIQHLTKIYKKPATTITNGIQNAIIHAWRVTPIEDLMLYYKARVNYETGVPTPMELIYYYRDKIKKKI
ncbi:MAG: response regulator [Clostridia bacterium]|nr:response regulator [Clostridia bacterium]